MKRAALLVAFAGAVGLIQQASAADLAVRAAPPPAPVPTWTGWYIGVHGGAGWESTPSWSVVNQGYVPGVSGFAPQTLTGSPGLGAVGGLQAGYNWQFAPTWVVGVEGDISWTSLGDTRTLRGAGANPTVVPPPIAISMSTTNQWLASARAKFGFTGWWNNTMLYATGGAAWANIDYNGNTQNVGTAPATAGNTFAFQSSTTKTGWVIGGGAEWQATTNILLRAEYLYYKFDNSFSTTVSGTSLSGAPLSGPGTTFSWNNYNVQVARVAVSYKF
jgi:outer membrane immunogenic protein